MTLAFIEGLTSPLHWLIIGFIALLIFGRRLPEVGRSMGRGIMEFKKGLKEAGDDINSQPQDPYNQGYQQQGYNQQQFPPPAQRPPQPYQQQGGYPQQQGNPYQQQPQRLPQQPMQPAGGQGGGQSQVRVTRNDMVD